MKAPNTKIAKDGTVYHDIAGVYIECSGNDCAVCNKNLEIAFDTWEASVPFPFPPKGKRYKNPLKQKNRGKTILEICYTCKKIPCYICKRIKCDKWMKEEHRKGQEKGCGSWENSRCADFCCDKGIISSHWRDNYDEITHE